MRQSQPFYVEDGAAVVAEDGGRVDLPILQGLTM